MSNYTKSTDFTAKDSLPSGDSQKVIRGSEFDTEFSAIATAVNSKADKSGDTVVLTAGTVSAPSLTTVGDTNTGIYFPAADKVAIATGGTQRVIVDDLGNVGVGTTPNAATTTTLFFGGVGAITAGNNSSLMFGNAYIDGVNSRYRTSKYATQYEQDNLNGRHYWYTAPSGTAGDIVTFTERMRLDSSGNLGIGTSSPSTKLHVNTGAAGYGITVAANTQTANTYQIGIDGNSSLSFYDTTAAAQRLVLSNSGNLGLGVTPSAWSGVKALQIGTSASFSGGSGFNDAFVASNAFYDGSNWKYINTNPAYYASVGGSAAARWYTAPSGTAGNAITFTQAMTLDASGNLGIGTSSPGSKLHLKGGGVVIKLETTGAIGSGSAAYINFDDSVGDSGYVGFGGTANTFDIYNRKNGALTFATNNTERARITSGGDFLVGTTATTGSQTNTTNTVVGKITSNNGSLEVANNTATTMLSVSAAGASTFLVTVTVISTDTGSNYTVLGLLRCGGTTDSYTNILTASYLTVSLSGSNLQVTQTSGALVSVTWSLLRLL